MRMILQKLSEEELSFLLKLLNSAKSETEIFSSDKLLRRIKARVSAEEAQGLDRTADRLRKRYEKGKVSDEIRPRNAYFGIAAVKRTVPVMCDEWSIARYPIVQAAVRYRRQPGNFVHLLVVGVPAHHPPVMVNTPTDLVNWLIARGMANRQLRRIVKCSREGCDRFGLRDRAKADARFCSVKCQQEFNLISRKMRPTGEFGHTG